MITIAARTRYEETIRRSRFIGIAERVDTVETAGVFLADVREPEATHCAWAYRIGPVVRCHDDGEVSGTAGKPILSVIERQDLDHVMVVVIRFYGGIKLGTGGLIRAYGGTASSCLDLAERLVVKPRVMIRFQIPFSDSGIVYSFLDSFPMERIGESFTQTGIVFDCRMDSDLLEPFKVAMMNLTKGRVSF